jgi:hypothetical protein
MTALEAIVSLAKMDEEKEKQGRKWWSPSVREK